MVVVRAKTCTKCGVEKPLTEFGKHRLSKDGHAYRCKECARKHSNAYSITSAGIYNQIKGRSNFYKRKGSKFYKPLNISKEDFIKWYESQERICVYCDIPEEKMKLIAEDFDGRVSRLQVDSMNNDIGYELGNIVLACHRCNFIKLNFLTFDEMYEFGHKYLKPKWQAKLCQKVNEDE